MSLFSRILAVLVVVLALPLAYFALATMARMHAWRTIYNEYEVALRVVPPETEAIQIGHMADRNIPVRLDSEAMKDVAAGRPLTVDAPPTSPAGQLTVAGVRIPVKVLEPGRPGILQLESVIHDLQVDRGMIAYSGVQRGSVSPETGEVTVTIADPTPHQIKPNMIVHLFDQAEKENGGQFLGTFRVQDVTEQGATLQPLRSMNDRQLTRLGNSSGPWVIYELMPRDRHDVFAHMDEDRLRALFPPEVVDQILRDGTPADDAGETVPGMVVAETKLPDGTTRREWERALTDFDQTFAHYHRRMAMARDRIVALKNDLAMTQQAKEDVDKRIAGKDQEIESLKEDLATTQAEQQLIANHHAALEARLTELEAERDRLLEENKRLAEEIAAAMRAVPSLLPPPENTPSAGTRISVPLGYSLSIQ